MNQPNLYRIPPTRTLITFESAARHQSFSKAAKELGIFQSAVSRQIATLEAWVSVPLFDRSPTGVTLTEAGKRLYGSIATGLGEIYRGIAEAGDALRENCVIIACSHAASQYIVMPRYGVLCSELGERVGIRVMVYDQDIKYLAPDPVADVTLTWKETRAPEPFRVTVLKDAVRPVCSPEYAETHAKILNGPVANWGALTFLDYTWPNEGWATWDDWFGAAGRPERTPSYIGLGTYAYVLEAAAAGRGIALGWRFFVDKYVATGTLVALGNRFIEYDNYLYCVLTEKGRRNPLAHKCLKVLENLEPL